MTLMRQIACFVLALLFFLNASGVSPLASSRQAAGAAPTPAPILIALQAPPET